MAVVVKAGLFLGRPQADVVAAELIAALCLATDFGMGFRFEHGVQRR